LKKCIDKTDFLLYIYRAMSKGDVSSLFLNIKVSAKSPLPVYEQIKLSIKLAIISGHLQEGYKLMPLREMAIKLQVNPNTILKVYCQLEKEGYIVSRLRSGYFVKFKKENLDKEKRDLLRALTSEYLSKAFQSGCSYENILNEISLVLGHENIKKYLKGGIDDIS